MKSIMTVLIALVLLVGVFPQQPVLASETECILVEEKTLEFGWIEGPAILQPAGEGYVISIYPGEEYFNQKDAGTMWVYSGNSDCLTSQYGSFEQFEIIEIRDLYVPGTPVDTCSFLEEAPLQRGWITGPAIIQPSGLGYIISVFPETKYYNQLPEGTLFRYAGDRDCLQSQYQSFPDFDIIEIEVVKHFSFLPLILSP